MTVHSTQSTLINNKDLSITHSVNLQPIIIHQSDNLLKESNNPLKQPHWTIKKQTNLAESDPVSFVQLLTDRLEKVKESRGKLEKLMSLVNHQVDESKNNLPMEQTNSSNGLISTNQHNLSFNSNNLNCSQFNTNSLINVTTTTSDTITTTNTTTANSSTSNPMNNNEVNSSTNQQFTFMPNPHHLISSQLFHKTQNAQDILDDHCSRIWSDESEFNMNQKLLLLSSPPSLSPAAASLKRQQPRQQEPQQPPILSVSSMKPHQFDTVYNNNNNKSKINSYELKKCTEPIAFTPVIVTSSTNSSCLATLNHCYDDTQPMTDLDNDHFSYHSRLNRLAKSDLRSIASWDSGVVSSSNYYYYHHHKNRYRLHHHHHPRYHDDLDIINDNHNHTNNDNDVDVDDDDDRVETASILEAASLQALSSSTTELALVNGEVTAKLVEKILRHYPHELFHHHHHHPVYPSYGRNSSTGNNSNNRLRKGGRRRSKHCESFYELSSYHPIHDFHANSTCSTCSTTTTTTTSVKNTSTTTAEVVTALAGQPQSDVMIPCECYHCVRCTRAPSSSSTLNDHSLSNYCHCNNNNNNNNTNSNHQHSTPCHNQYLPPMMVTASDTSSTFDSGISSAYDQLPLRKQINNCTNTNNNNRENRSQSLHNWQTDSTLKDTLISTSRGSRTHSASKSMYNDDNNKNTNTTTNCTNEFTPTNCLISSCYEFNSNETTSKQLLHQPTMNNLQLCNLCSSIYRHHYHHGYPDFHQYYRHHSHLPQPSHHHHHHHHRLLQHSHCPELLINNDLNSKCNVNNNNNCEKPASGKLLQHWLKLQQNPLENVHSPCGPTITSTATATTTNDHESEHKTNCISSNNVELLPSINTTTTTTTNDNNNSQSKFNKNCKALSSYARKSHHHQHQYHGHRKSSAHRIASNNVHATTTTTTTTDNSNSHNNNNNDNNLELNKNIQRDSSDNNYDDNNNNENNNTTSSHVNSSSSLSLSSSSSSTSSLMIQPTYHTTTSNSTAITNNSSNNGLIVGYYLCDDPVPYRTVWTGSLQNSSVSTHGTVTSTTTTNTTTTSSGLFVDINNQLETVDSGIQTKFNNQSLLTLGQFKQLIAKKGVYRYFFKKPNDEFGTGVVHEELTNDNAVLPLWDGKVVARVERAD
ncbi:unnamed protein product [Schistosoma turkestanicum]|nr:unnamed protein product [Schistosoma turkestanicum]